MIDMLDAAAGKLRALAALAAIAVTATAGSALGGAPAAWADGGTSGNTGSGISAAGSGGSNQAALQVQAQELAAQILADGRRLDQMAEAVNAAQLRSQQLASRLAALQSDMAQTDAEAVAAKAALRQQAVLSYVVGGAPAISSVPRSARTDPNLAISYAEIVTGGQKRAVEAYRAALAAQASDAQQVLVAQHEAAVNLQQLEAARSSAAQADTARRQSLSQVTSELAVLVAQVQAAQEAAAKAAVLTSTTPRPVGHGVTPSTPPSTSATTTRHYNPPPAQPTTPGFYRTTTTSPATAAQPQSGSPQGGQVGAQAPGANKATAYARAQLGKPYQWGAAGPNSFDCSGLTMMAWRQAGVSFPHLAQDQYDMTQRESISETLPGDLIFFGTPSNVYHVGIYIGNGQMIDAPETGQNVSIQSIYWSDLLGAGRVTG